MTAKEIDSYSVSISFVELHIKLHPYVTMQTTLSSLILPYINPTPEQSGMQWILTFSDSENYVVKLTFKFDKQDHTSAGNICYLE